MLPALMPLATSLLRPASGRRPLVAGVLSGTSADGIDVVLAEAKTTEAGSDAPQRLAGLEAVAFATEPFDAGIRGRLRRVLDGESPTLSELARLDRDLGLAFGTAARRVADRHDVGELVLVASHGQTVFHHDGDEGVGKVSLQIGDGDFVAEAAGVGVASDFRQRDCASGGEGAPLVALVDDVLFAGAPRPLAILNLGGIANWTLLPGHDAGSDAKSGEGTGSVARVTGFDVGPAGALLDGLCRRLFECPFDEGGRAALAGEADDRVVATLLRHPFLQKVGPRSTGRDTFGEDFVGEVLREASGLEPGGVLATACRFVAQAAGAALRRSLVPSNAAPRVAESAPRPWHVALAGGGGHNAALVGELDRATLAALEPGPGRASFGSCAAFGVPADAREALAFAALGTRLILGEPSTDPGVTGAASGRILGKWSPPARELHGSR